MFEHRFFDRNNGSQENEDEVKDGRPIDVSGFSSASKQKQASDSATPAESTARLRVDDRKATFDKRGGFLSDFQVDNCSSRTNDEPPTDEPTKKSYRQVICPSSVAVARPRTRRMYHEIFETRTLISFLFLLQKEENAARAAQDGVTVRFKCPIFKYFFNFIFFPFLFFIKSFECNKSHRPALTHTRSARRAIECSRNKVKSTRGKKRRKEISEWISETTEQPSRKQERSKSKYK